MRRFVQIVVASLAIVACSPSSPASLAAATPRGDDLSASGAAISATAYAPAAAKCANNGSREFHERCADAPDDAQCAIAFWLYAIGAPLLFAIGTVGNALTIVVMATKTMRRTAFGAYIAAIAVADTLVLWTTLPRHFILWVWQVDIREISTWSCRILRFLQFSLMNTSAYLLVTVTAERFLTVYFPARFRFYQQRSRALCVIIGVLTFQFAWNVHIFWTLAAAHDDSCRKCIPVAAADYYWNKVHPWLDFTKLSLLPFALMLSMNVAIMAGLSHRSSAGSGERSHPLLVCGASLFACGSAKRFKGRKPSTTDGKTAMLLWASFFYLLATMPTFVATVLNNTSRGAPLFTSVSHVLLYANNAANFFLYSLSGATFRRLFLATFAKSSSDSRQGGGGCAAHAITEAADLPSQD